MKQWIEEDQDGDLGLAILALIYSLGARFKAELESQTYYNNTRNESS